MHMNLKLEIENNGVLLTEKLTEKKTIGRAVRQPSADILLAGDYISRMHGTFTPTARGCMYTDCNSTNGTWLNGRLMDRGATVTLHNGDVLQICGRNPHNSSEVTNIYYIVPSETLGALTSWKKEGLHSLGSIDELDNMPVVIKDAPVKPPVKRPERPAASVTKTPRKAVPAGPRNPAGGYANSSDSLNINIRERTVSSLGRKTTLLRDVRMTIPAGNMVLILGGSGAGKTTFMNAVMGYEKADANIMYGSRDIYKEFDTMKFEIGYVPQQDLMRGSDSVYETLRNAAEMKLPPAVRGDRREARIQYVLEMLGLSREKDTAVSRLSGGQRKRLSIALEYVSNPSLFFLDEPDSGLDGVMARSLMNSLRSIADEGKIIMVISHGPDRARELFDKVIVLAKSQEDNCGRLAFYGTVEEALAFFNVDSLEGVVMRINRPDEGGEGLADMYISRFAAIHGERNRK